MICTVCGKATNDRCKECALPYCNVACHESNYTGERCVFVTDIARHALDNSEFGPKVLYNDPSGRVQVALMSVPVGGVVEMEVHAHLTQVVHIIGGEGEVEIGGVTRQVAPGFVALVPSGTAHELRNTGDVALDLYTLYVKNTTEEWVH